MGSFGNVSVTSGTSQCPKCVKKGWGRMPPQQDSVWQERIESAYLGLTQIAEQCKCDRPCLLRDSQFLTIVSVLFCKLQPLECIGDQLLDLMSRKSA
jgi:hypothetical protein